MPGSYVTVLITALLLAVSATPLARLVALRVGLVDHPGPRKEHRTPIPLLGGLAMYSAVVGSLVALRPPREIGEAAGVLVGASWMAFFGLWDDRQGLPVWAKLLAQTGAATILVASGVQVLLPVPPGVNLFLTFFWVIGITNALNLLDNMDGLSSGVGAMAAGGFLVLSLLHQQYLVSVLAAAVLGACVGFLVHNFNPARIYMGDGGSLFLGFLLAALGIIIKFPSNRPTVTWMVPILVLGVPIFDTTLIFMSRLRRGLNPLATPGRDHLSHRLVELGASKRCSVLVHYLVGALLVALAYGVSLSRLPVALVIGVVTVLGAGGALLYLLRLELVRGSRQD